VPRPVEGDDNYTHEHVERVGSGFYNTLAMCRSGALYCAGENQNKQCGVMGGTNNIFKMSRVIEVKEKHVVASEGGYCHTLVLDQNGEVMTLGCGDEGQRGDGVSEAMYEEMQGSSSRPVVSQVTLPCRAIGIAAGANHSVVLGENGEVFAFGSNEYGQCGLTMSTSSDGKSNSDEDDDNDSSHVLAPVRVMLPADAGRAVSVSAGYAHTVVRDEHGAVFTFGQNENGQLGLGCVIGIGVEARDSPTKVSFG
jgi:alpha-tubulin suppressor-like RCC1 family protein